MKRKTLKRKLDKRRTRKRGGRGAFTSGASQELAQMGGNFQSKIKTFFKVKLPKIFKL